MRDLILQKNEVVARLGNDVARVAGPRGSESRNHPQDWRPGKFVHPHDARFGQDGSIFWPSGWPRDECQNSNDSATSLATGSSDNIG